MKIKFAITALVGFAIGVLTTNLFLRHGTENSFSNTLKKQANINRTDSDSIEGNSLYFGRGQAVQIYRVGDRLETKKGEDIIGGSAVISRFKFTPSDSSPKSFIVSGTVVSDNNGAGLSCVLVRVGEDKAIPSLAGMTNVNGEFKFRLWVDEDNQRHPPEMKEPFDGYIYIGGQVTDLDEDLEGKEGFIIGSLLRRYKLSDLIAIASKKNVEQAAP